ncbi:MAG TPA: DUF5694 domain-containing protein [Steroidobacteraceae bacterium]|nr:DUF5694 domain-containing protein [Steroidobacteraceae bacterium]
MAHRAFRPFVILSMLISGLALAVAHPISALAASAQEAFSLISQRSPAERPMLMVVGVAHFDNPARDVVNTKVDNVLALKRQQEIVALVNQLAKFRPSHVAVEWPATKQEKIDARYAAYRAGTYELSSDERDQLGLRLAAKLRLPRVDAVDWLGEPPGKDEDYDYQSYAIASDDKARLAALSDPKKGEQESAMLGRMTMGGFLAYLNGPSHLAKMHSEYFDYAMFGNDEKAPGANWAGAWFTRNLRIFAKLVRIADKPNDRVLVIYGAGHAYLLNQYATESRAFRIERPVQLLLQSNEGG